MITGACDAVYALLIAMPLVGWSMLSAGGYPIVLGGSIHLPKIVPHNDALYAVLRGAHMIPAFVFFATILLHVAAALFHALIRQDGVFSSMVTSPLCADSMGQKKVIFRRLGNGSVEPYSLFSVIADSRGRVIEAPMIDHPQKTARLLTALKAAVPFEVELVPSLVNYLRAQHVAVADQSRHTVSDLSYGGDEGGIVCHIVPPGKREALVVSLTQVRVPRSMPLAAAVADYHNRRVKKLKKQARA